MSDRCICRFDDAGQPIYWCAYHAAQKDRIAALEEALRGIVRVADRKTPEFDAARAALENSSRD